LITVVVKRREEKIHLAATDRARQLRKPPMPERMAII